jgi:hypothetical protein
MRLLPRILSLSRWPVLSIAPLAVAMLLLAACGRSHRPASALSEQDQTVLADYEKMRAGLADDNPREVKAAATNLLGYLKKEPASPETSRLIEQTQTVLDARALDSMREVFRSLSNSLIPVADGVDGYYIMTCPPGFQGDWIQRTPEVDNPYFGKVMRNSGSLRK